MEIVSKITMRVVCGEVKPLLADKESVDLALILGYAIGVAKGDKPTQYGDNIWIEGQFKAQNLLNKKFFYSSKLYPPEIMHNLIATQLKAEPDQKVQFAFIVGIKKSNAVIGYEYTIKSLIEPKEENDPFAAIEHQLGNTLRLESKQGVKDPSQIPFNGV